MVEEALQVAARAVWETVLEPLLMAVFYWPGWLSLRIVTFGRYPPARGVPHNRMAVATFGLAVPIALVSLLALG